MYLAYTRFVNTMKQEPVIEQLLPLSAEQFERKDEDGTTPSTQWDYIYEPDAQAVVDELLVRYVEALVYQAVAENMASEQSARMVAMKAARTTRRRLSTNCSSCTTRAVRPRSRKNCRKSSVAQQRSDPDGQHAADVRLCRRTQPKLRLCASEELSI